MTSTFGAPVGRPQRLDRRKRRVGVLGVVGGQADVRALGNRQNRARHIGRRHWLLLWELLRTPSSRLPGSRPPRVNSLAEGVARRRRAALPILLSPVGQVWITPRPLAGQPRLSATTVLLAAIMGACRPAKRIVEAQTTRRASPLLMSARLTIELGEPRRSCQTFVLYLRARISPAFMSTDQTSPVSRASCSSSRPSKPSYDAHLRQADGRRAHAGGPSRRAFCAGGAVRPLLLPRISHCLLGLP